MSIFLTEHLKNAAEYANRKLDISYYFYHAWIALKCGVIYYYIAFFSPRCARLSLSYYIAFPDFSRAGTCADGNIDINCGCP